jgi:hypothetical protein
MKRTKLSMLMQPLCQKMQGECVSCLVVGESARYICSCLLAIKVLGNLQVRYGLLARRARMLCLSACCWVRTQYVATVPSFLVVAPDENVFFSSVTWRPIWMEWTRTPDGHHRREDMMKELPLGRLESQPRWKLPQRSALLQRRQRSLRLLLGQPQLPRLPYQQQHQGLPHHLHHLFMPPCLCLDHRECDPCGSWAMCESWWTRVRDSS